MPIQVQDVLLIEPEVFNDERGFFFESYNRRAFAALVGRDVDFVQDNHSRSAKNVLRGLHYQVQHPQGKLVRVTCGAVLDVAVDLRPDSPSYKQHIVVELSAENKRALWIPEGFAHGFRVLSDTADVSYKTTDYQYPEHERCLRWDDPDLNIDWRLDGDIILSPRDARGTT